MMETELAQKIINLKDREAEQASRHLAAVVESSDDAIASKDLNGIVTSWNRAAEHLFGYTAAEMVGKPITIIIPPDRADEEAEILSRIKRGERIEHYETVRRRKDGTSVDISLTISPIRDARGEIIGASKIARDITKRKQADAALHEARDALAKANADLERRVRERTAELERANAALVKEMEEQKRLEAQLRQAQKMESIGTLAGGIAHDFNNVLNIVKGYASAIAANPAINGEIHEQLAIIDEATERGAGVVRQLLTLARKAESHLISSDVNDLVSGLANLLKQTLPKTIEVFLDLRPALPAVMVDPNQLTQALLNLCVNARDAMPDGGKLTLKTSLADGSSVKDIGRPGQRYICIEVIDTGMGIAETVRGRIFEPFFTTKGVGEGTGLGLSIVYGIVKNHNGAVDLESAPNRGAKFRIFLPVMPAEKQPHRSNLANRQSSGENKRRKGKSVLLVDDEERMVYLLEKALLRNGYTVLTALDGEEALRVFGMHKDTIDVVFLDLGLPKKAGHDVLLKMKEDNPDVAIVVSSGYIDPESKAQFYQSGVKYFMNKPYTPKDVLEMLESVLETNGPSPIQVS